MSTIFRDRVITELIYLLISAAMVSMMLRRLIWIHFFCHFLAIRLYHRLTVILTSHFSNITYFRQQQQENKPMKYYEILPTHTETPRNATRKTANLCIEFNYHFLTLQKKIPLLLNRSVNVGRILAPPTFLDWHAVQPKQQCTDWRRCLSLSVVSLLVKFNKLVIGTYAYQQQLIWINCIVNKISIWGSSFVCLCHLPTSKQYLAKILCYSTQFV